MRVLYVTEGFPYPLTSGSLRHYHLIRGLSERHEILLLSMVGASFDAAHTDALRPYCIGIDTFRSTAEASIGRKLVTWAGNLTVGRGTPAAARSLAGAAARLLDESDFDVVLVNGRATSTVLDRAGATPVVVDLCDALTPRLTAQLRYTRPAQRPLIRLRRRRFQAAERRLIAGADHLLFAAARDRDEALHGASHSPPATILPNGVDIEYWHRTQPVLGDEVAFSGAMHYPPNDDAARLLVTTIMPRVWEVRPDVRLRIIGRDATGALLRAAAGESRVTVTGYVDDVRPHLERAAVYAAPLRFASGIQNKLLEALAMELPTVTSALGAAGLRRDGVEPPLVVADDPDAVARAILGSLERVSEDRTPHHPGRAFVRDRFSWPEAVRILEGVLADVTAEGPRPLERAT